MHGRKATVDDYVEAIRDHDRPALTKQDIADVVGVSRQTVHNHSNDLEDDPRVESGQIGKATVYWWDPSTPADEKSDKGSRPQEDDRSEESSRLQGTESDIEHSEEIANQTGIWGVAHVMDVFLLITGTISVFASLGGAIMVGAYYLTGQLPIVVLSVGAALWFLGPFGLVVTAGAILWKIAGRFDVNVTISRVVER